MRLTAVFVRAAVLTVVEEDFQFRLESVVVVDNLWLFVDTIGVEVLVVESRHDVGKLTAPDFSDARNAVKSDLDVWTCDGVDRLERVIAADTFECGEIGCSASAISIDVNCAEELLVELGVPSLNLDGRCAVLEVGAVSRVDFCERFLLDAISWGICIVPAGPKRAVVIPASSWASWRGSRRVEVVHFWSVALVDVDAASAEGIAAVDGHFDVPPADKGDGGEETDDELRAVEWSTVERQHSVQMTVDSVAFSLTPDLVVLTLASLLGIGSSSEVDLLRLEVVSVDCQVDLTKRRSAGGSNAGNARPVANQRADSWPLFRELDVSEHVSDESILSRLSVLVDGERDRFVTNESLVIEELPAKIVLSVVDEIFWNAKCARKIPGARLGQWKRLVVFNLRGPQTEVFLLDNFANKLHGVKLIFAIYSFDAPTFEEFLRKLIFRLNLLV
jgi:hypothetical protein